MNTLIDQSREFYQQHFWVAIKFSKNKIDVAES